MIQWRRKCGVYWLAEESAVPEGELHSVMLFVIHLSAFAYWAVHYLWEAYCIRIFWFRLFILPPPTPIRHHALCCGPTRAMASSLFRFIHHTQRRIMVGRNPLDERRARRRGLYLTTHNSHNRKDPYPRRDSNPKSQQARDRRPTP
jgi:hypothetical protein